jgi:nitronate monooxygenase
MAGGVSTPALVAAVGSAGALGFLAAGYRDPDGLRADIREVRAQSAAPFGVNVFVPADLTDATDRSEPTEPARLAEPAWLGGYRAALAAEERRYGVSLGTPPAIDTDHWDEKLALLAEERVPVVSFTFGCPPGAVVDRLHAAGSCVVGTVTSGREARVCVDAGLDALCVQGPEAGGHRGSFPPRPPAGEVGLLPLLALVRDEVDVDLIAAGGLMDGASVAAVLAAGACAAQLGTAFLGTPESGAHALHKAALVDPAFPGTTVTTAFTGRPARYLVNRFIETLDALAPPADARPPAYPAVHHLTLPIRRASAAAGDPDAMTLFAGQGHRLARDLPAARLVEVLAAEAAQAAAVMTRRLAPPADA